MADFSQSENVWRIGAGRDMVKLPPDAITHWMPLPVAAGLDGAAGVSGGQHQTFSHQTLMPEDTP